MKLLFKGDTDRAGVKTSLGMHAAVHNGKCAECEQTAATPENTHTAPLYSGRTRNRAKKKLPSNFNGGGGGGSCANRRHRQTRRSCADAPPLITIMPRSQQWCPKIPFERWRLAARTARAEGWASRTQHTNMCTTQHVQHTTTRNKRGRNKAETRGAKGPGKGSEADIKNAWLSSVFG